MTLHKCIVKALLLLSLLGNVFNLIHCFEFDQNNVAVYFTPFVKRGGTTIGKQSLEYSITFENIKTMLEIVSVRFSKVFTSGTGALDREYIYRSTYYGGCWPDVYSAEAAAIINKERNTTALTVEVAINQRFISKSFETDIAVALESVDIANSIFPGTVESVWLMFAKLFEDDTRSILKYLNGIKIAASLLNIKVGSKLNCGCMEKQKNDTLCRLHIEILNKVDFVVCDVSMGDVLYAKGVEEGFRLTANFCSGKQQAVRKYKPGANVMCTAKWTTAGEDEWQTVENQRKYWEKASEWAASQNTMMIMKEAFDYEINGLTEDSHMGWWRLTENSKVDTADGYLEKSTGLTGIANSNHSGHPYTKLNRTIFKNDELGVDTSKFAVRFTPFVKSGVNDKPNGYYRYTYDDVNTMIQLVSGKFSKIFTTGVGSNNDDYFRNLTYYNSYAIAYSAEAAAHLNQKLMNKNLSVVVGINTGFLSTSLETEVAVAFESVQKANNIFPRTVEGIYFRWPLESPEDGLQVIEQLKAVRIPATLMNIKVGVLINCKDFLISKNITLLQIQQEMVNLADFVICPLTPQDSVAELGPEFSFRTIFHTFLSQKFAVQKVNFRAEVMLETMWSSSGEKQWQTTENLEIYWNTAKDWAENYKVTVIMAEAFDNQIPGMTNSSSLGWWRLKDNSKINSLDGYQEKILDDTDTTTGKMESTTEMAESTTHAASDKPQNTKDPAYIQLSLPGFIALIVGSVVAIGGVLVCTVIVFLIRRQNNRNFNLVNRNETDGQSLRDMLIGNDRDTL